MKILLAVAVGGAIGAVGRYLVISQVGHWLGTGFPYGTLTVNVVGSSFWARWSRPWRSSGRPRRSCVP